MHGAAALLLSGISGAARAQTGGKVFRIGYLANHIPLSELPPGPTSPLTSAVAFLEGMKVLGWEEGKNIRVAWRSAESRFDRHPRLAEELVRMGVDVIVSFSEGVDAAAGATRTIPIVMGGYYRPVEAGLAQSLGRPGGNVTGIASSAGAEMGKTLSLMKEAVPAASRIAILYYARGEFADRAPVLRPDSPLAKLASALRLELFFQTLGDADTLDAAIRGAVLQGANAIYVDGTYAIYGKPGATRLIAEAAIRHRVPIMQQRLHAVAEGGLMAHGIDDTREWRRIPYYVDRILRGGKPGEIPIEQPSTLEFHVNLTAAKAIGLEIPPALLLQADRVIP